MMKKIFFSVIIITCIFRAQASASSAAGMVEKGNRLYHDQKYEDALKHYEQALSRQPDSEIINFDAGAAQYKTKEYQKANSSFEKSLITEDKRLEAKANYNLGNSKYMLGLSKENTDLPAAVRLLEGALNNYKRTQELTPKGDDVQVNYKIVKEKLKELKEKLKQQPQENRKQRAEDGKTEKLKNEKAENQNTEKTKEQQGQQEQQKAEAGELKNEKTEELKNERSKEQKQEQKLEEKEQKSEGKEQEAGREEEKKSMSKQEANMLLEAYRQEENTTGILKDDRKGREEKVLKDW